MQHSGVIQGAGVMRHEVPLLVRFLGKLVLEVLPAALASVIGGFLFTQYQFGHPAAPQPVAGQAAPASAEMMQVVRDEHAMILDFLKAQRAAEKSRLASAEEEDASAAADAKVAATRVVATALVASKRPAPRNKATASPAAAAAAASHTPLVIARVEQNESAPPAEATARHHVSLVAKTLAIKDHVLTATLRVVSAIGGIPSWIASMGDRIGGADTDSSERQLSAS